MNTTLNIHQDTLHEIDNTARILGVSRSVIIVMVMKKLMANITCPARPGTMVRYQGRKRADDWHTFHIRFRMDDYEYFLDLRKLMKMSVSLILAYAVKKFLGKMIKMNIADNYLCKNYVVIREIIEDIISWRFIWGYPPDMAKRIS